MSEKPTDRDWTPEEAATVIHMMESAHCGTHLVVPIRIAHMIAAALRTLGMCYPNDVLPGDPQLLDLTNQWADKIGLAADQHDRSCKPCERAVENKLTELKAKRN